MSRVCRTCLKAFDDPTKWYTFDKQFPSEKYPTLKDRCQMCIPEIDFTVLSSTVLCQLCYRKIITIFNFKTMCIINEQTFHTMNLEQAVNNENIAADHLYYLVEEEVIEEVGPNEVTVEDIQTEVTIEENEAEARDEKVTFNCNYCSFRAANQHLLIKHIATHKSNVKCNKRGKFPYLMFVYENNSEWTCDICNKTFAERKLAVQHVRFHLERKTYKCTTCGSACSSKESLKIHMRRHYNLKPLECDYCPYKTIYKSGMQLHLKRHTGEKPHKCTKCDFECLLLPSLRAHMSKHDGEKPFQCDTCKRKYFYVQSLVNHKKTHLKVKPFKCGECDKSFPFAHELKRHAKTHERARRMLEIKQASQAKKIAVESITTDMEDTGTGITEGGDSADKVVVYKTYPCDKCQFLALTIGAYRNHIKLHDENLISSN